MYGTHTTYPCVLIYLTVLEKHPIFQVIPNIATKVVEIDIQTTQKEIPYGNKDDFYTW